MVYLRMHEMLVHLEIRKVILDPELGTAGRHSLVWLVPPSHSNWLQKERT